MQGGEAGDWIRWAMGGAVSFVVGLVGGSWAARGMLEEMRQKAAVHEVRLAALELDRETIRETGRETIREKRRELMRELGSNDQTRPD